MPRGRETKKGAKGALTQFIHRDKALKKLQIGLRVFRKLCILKGIYPREPPKNVTKSGGSHRTWYSVKDIQFIAHDPLLQQLRDLRVYRRKLRHLQAKREHAQLKLMRKQKPTYNIDHTIKERYPTLLDAVKDLDDSLSLVHLFATLPQNKNVKSFIVAHCSRLALEYQNWVMRSHSLNKVFLSIKGIYIQVIIMGQPVTYLQPYPFAQHVPRDVDMRIMLSFVEFYSRQLGYVLHHLYQDLGLQYPPAPDRQLQYAGASVTAFQFDPVQAKQQKKLEQTVSSVVKAIEAQGFEEDDLVEDDEDDEDDEQGDEDKVFGDSSAKSTHTAASQVFSGLKIFIQRENMQQLLQFLITSAGGTAGWPGAGSPFGADSDQVTHVISDRPVRKGGTKEQPLDREVVQPQWIFDSINEHRLLPVHEYAPGVQLPPHLSPFVKDDEAGYVPPRRLALDAQVAGDDEEEQQGLMGMEEEDDDRAVDAEERYAQGIRAETNADEALTEEEMRERRLKRKRERREKALVKQEEQKDLAAGILSRRKRRLYNRIQYSRNKKASQIDLLKEKRKQWEEAQK